MYKEWVWGKKCPSPNLLPSSQSVFFIHILHLSYSEISRKWGVHWAPYFWNLQIAPSLALRAFILQKSYGFSKQIVDSFYEPLMQLTFSKTAEYIHRAFFGFSQKWVLSASKRYSCINGKFFLCFFVVQNFTKLLSRLLCMVLQYWVL